MAGSKRPSYLKRQKEQRRLARAAEKRRARLDRRHSASLESEEPSAPDQPMEGVASDEVERPETP